jgi:hypothetical protein
MLTFLEDNPYDADQHYLDYVPGNFEMEKIKADVLLTTCVDDHFVLSEFMDEMKRGMINAASIKTCTFLPEEQASHHCAVGNQRLALSVLADWLDHSYDIYKLASAKIKSPGECPRAFIGWHRRFKY